MKENTVPPEAKHKLPKMNEKIKLTVPLEVQGQKLKELNMRRCTVGDQLRADQATNSDAEREMFVMAALLDLAPDDLHTMDMSDYLKCQEVYKSFLS